MKKKRNLMLFAILILAVGFAALATNLNINGSTSVGIGQKDFEVYYSKAMEDGVENNALVEDNTHISFRKAMSAVGEKYVIDYDVTNGSRNYDASVTISCTESTEYLKVTNEFDSTTNLEATETRSGKLTIEVIKPYIGTETESSLDTEISCSIGGEPIEREEAATGIPASKIQESNWEITNDADHDEKVSIGDLITIGTESFYVYNVDDSKIKAISQYNLLVGSSNVENETGLQDSSAIGYKSKTKGTVPFDSTSPFSNQYNDSTIKTLVDAYKKKISAYTISNIGLITKDELKALGCTDNSCKNAPGFLYETSYWTSSPSENYTSGVSALRSDGYFNTALESNTEIYGVRPVITISNSLATSKLKNDADGDGRLSIGDLIALGNEAFYIYNIDGSTVKAIARYNLLVGDYNGTRATGLQDSSAIGEDYNIKSTYVGTIPFDSSENLTSIYTDSTIKAYVDSYKEKLNELGGYVKDVNLITLAELKALGCGDSFCKSVPSFLYTTSYWVDSTSSNNVSYTVRTDGALRTYQVSRGDRYGVRPVITISKSLIK